MTLEVVSEHNTGLGRHLRPATFPSPSDAHCQLVAPGRSRHVEFQDQPKTTVEPLQLSIGKLPHALDEVGPQHLLNIVDIGHRSLGKFGYAALQAHRSRQTQEVEPTRQRDDQEGPDPRLSWWR